MQITGKEPACDGDYGSHDAFQFLPLTAAAEVHRGGHIRYAPEFGEDFGQTS